MIRNRETGADEVIWSVIHYLDPDLENKRSDSAVIFSVLFAALLIGAILIFKLRGL